MLVQVEMMSLEQWQGGEKPSVGTLVAVFFSEDGLVYRAKVTSFENYKSIIYTRRGKLRLTQELKRTF